MVLSSTKGPDPPKRVRRLEKDGKMLNVNEGRYARYLWSGVRLTICVPVRLTGTIFICKMMKTTASTCLRWLAQGI